MRDGARHDSAPIIGGRREAREQALLLLYEAEIRDLTPEAMVDEVVVEPEAYTLEIGRAHV